MVQTTYANNKEVPYSSLCIWSDESTPDGDLRPEQLLHYGAERVVGGDDNEIADNDDPIFCSSTFVHLQGEVPFQSHQENYRIGSFIKAKTIIKVNSAE